MALGNVIDLTCRAHALPPDPNKVRPEQGATHFKVSTPRYTDEMGDFATIVFAQLFLLCYQHFATESDFAVSALEFAMLGWPVVLQARSYTTVRLIANPFVATTQVCRLRTRF